VEGLSFCFNGQGEPVFADFSLTLGEENPVVFLGPSGCGKTTLLRLMAGLLQPASGRVRVLGLSPDKPRFSFVFQEPRLLPWLSVLENVRLPLTGLLDRKEAEARARYFLRETSLEDKAASFPGELSGGQRQRVAIARAFAYPAPVLFLDEPFQSLDIPLRLELMDMTRALLRGESRLVVAVTHDPRDAIYLGRRIIVLGQSPGGVVFDEPLDLPPPDRAYTSPAHSGLEERLLAALGGGAIRCSMAGSSSTAAPEGSQRP
jgi:NitT/TauT family transport system ATP-binding protein